MLSPKSSCCKTSHQTCHKKKNDRRKINEGNCGNNDNNDNHPKLKNSLPLKKNGTTATTATTKTILDEIARNPQRVKTHLIRNKKATPHQTPFLTGSISKRTTFVLSLKNSFPPDVRTKTCLTWDPSPTTSVTSPSFQSLRRICPSTISTTSSTFKSGSVRRHFGRD